MFQTDCFVFHLVIIIHKSREGLNYNNFRLNAEKSEARVNEDNDSLSVVPLDIPTERIGLKKK